MGTFLKECFLQKTNQYDALKIWNKLDVSEKLLLRENEKGDIVAKYKGKDNVEYIVGVLSKEDAQSLIPYFAEGWNKGSGPDKEDDLYSSIISRFDKNADENKRISICIFIEYCRKK